MERHLDVDPQDKVYKLENLMQKIWVFIPLEYC
jgi:hypothetical protein